MPARLLHAAAYTLAQANLMPREIAGSEKRLDMVLTAGDCAGMTRQARISEACCCRVSAPQLRRTHARTVTTICCAHSSRASRLTVQPAGWMFRRLRHHGACTPHAHATGPRVDTEGGQGKDRLRRLARVGHDHQCHGSEYHRGCEHGGPAYPAHQVSAPSSASLGAGGAVVAPGTLPRTSSARHTTGHAAEAQRCLTALNWRLPGAEPRWTPSLLHKLGYFWIVLRTRTQGQIS